jgi:hypothetical protein
LKAGWLGAGSGDAVFRVAAWLAREDVSDAAAPEVVTALLLPLSPPVHDAWMGVSV